MRIFYLLCAGFLIAGFAGPARAWSIPGQNHLSLQYPGAPKPVYDDPNPPYAMTYADEAARTLGIVHGHMDVFSTHPTSSSYLPSFSGGLSGDGAMVRLKWHPGE
jgi:hypothetical protein